MLHTVDTCNPLDSEDNCILEEDGKTIDPSTKWPTLVRVVRACSAHKGLSDTDLYAAVIQEQKGRSGTLAEAQALVEPAVRQAAQQYLDLFSTDELERLVQGRIGELTQHTFSWDKDRKLNITFSDLSSAQKTQVQTEASQRLGAGKVKVQ